VIKKIDFSEQLINNNNNMNKSNMTIEALRKDGNKVRVKHYRYTNMARGVSKKQILHPLREIAGPARHSKGGLTIIEIDAKNGSSYVGKAECSRHDNFCYKTGVKIALGRLEEKNKFDFFSLAKKIVAFFGNKS
jgi:hypothetical protein